MKLLLVAVNAKYIHSNLAVYSLKASAGKYGPLVELAEYTINNQTEDIFRSVYQKRPDVLFFSCYIWNRREILEIAGNIRKVRPETVIWAGGPEVTYDAARFLKENPQFDGVMRGEGERTFFWLLQYYVDGAGGLGDIPGITYRCAGEEIRNTPPAEPMGDLDYLPFVYQKPEEFEHKIIYYESSRGCPFSCSYCLSSIDKRVRFRSLELVKRELAFLLDHRVPQVKFVDRTFNCNHPHAMEIWQFIRDHDNGVTNFHFEIAADILTDEELKLLAQFRPGLAQLEIGVQTVNEKALEAIHRTARFDQIADRVRRIAAGKNIHQHLDLIAGLPYEDYESFKHSFDTVYSLKPQELQLGFLKVLRGSEMYVRAKEYGIVYRSSQPYEVLSTEWISCDELMRLKEVEEMLEVYYNSQQFRFTMEALERYFARPFAMYEAMADYYKEHCLTGRAYSRMQRFEILRAFIREVLEGDAREAFDELLTMDFYLRENGKTRPAWAEDLSPYKESISGFYRREAAAGALLPEHRGMTWKQTMRMTHMEHFSYSLTAEHGLHSRWLLFDYSRRDPLTGDALVQEVEI